MDEPATPPEPDLPARDNRGPDSDRTPDPATPPDPDARTPARNSTRDPAERTPNHTPGPATPPDPDDRTPDPDRPVPIAVTVTRTGGFAGLRRTWHVEPEPTEAADWMALIAQCPWDAASPTPPARPGGADRFVWHVRARWDAAEQEAVLPESQVHGPWRELIDAVRSAAPPSPPPGGRPTTAR